MSGSSAGHTGVVVGVDGSDASFAALAHAAWEADRRGAPLSLVHCYDVAPALTALGLGPDPAPEQTVAQAAAQLLAELAEQARAAYPRLDVACAVVAGHPGGCLVQASEHAQLVVVGSRGLGGFTRLRLGSVGAQLAAHSAAPVLVIRSGGEGGPGRAGRDALGAPPSAGPVVVGVDGLPDSEDAIAFAFDEAAARDVPVVVLYAWWMLPVSRLQPAGTATLDPRAEPDLQRAEEEARRLLAEASAGARAQYPGLAVTLLPAHALNPVVALLEASDGAGLLVVSRHGGNALTRLLFSSIGDIAVREASCSVAVVPETSTREVVGHRSRRTPASVGVH